MPKCMAQMLCVTERINGASKPFYNASLSLVPIALFFLKMYLMDPMLDSKIRFAGDEFLPARAEFLRRYTLFRKKRTIQIHRISCMALRV